MNAIVNTAHFWEALIFQVEDGFHTVEQKNAVAFMKHLVHDIEVRQGGFVGLQIETVEDMLVITVTEANDDMQLVVNGEWFRAAIEPDGYIVLTGSSLPTPVTGRPVTS